MHSDVKTMRTKIQPTNVQCHLAMPNDTLELQLPKYGSINSIRLSMNLDGGIGEASFQPAGYSRPNSDCEGIPFTPPANTQTLSTTLITEDIWRRKNSGQLRLSDVQWSPMSYRQG